MQPLEELSGVEVGAVTDGQKTLVVNALAPILSVLLFGFFLYVSREFISTMRADQAAQSRQLRELEQTVRERSIQMQYLESQMHEMKQVLDRIDQKIDRLQKS